jgi:hypothetical protein
MAPVTRPAPKLVPVPAPKGPRGPIAAPPSAPPLRSAAKSDYTEPSPANAVALTSSPGATIVPTRVAPQWMGNTSVLLAGQLTAQAEPVASFIFNSGVRQSAEQAAFSFEVWAPGTTDRLNPDLWRDLDVQVHYRYGKQGSYQTDYVDLETQTNNNARYSVNLRKFDPWSVDGVSHPKARTGIPVVDKKDAAGKVVGQQATMSFFMTVNGFELRPAPGSDFEGTFANA